MDANIWNIMILVGIMILAGGFGGLANYLSTNIEETETSPCVKRMLLGIAAAVVVPLFLNMISSSILSDTMSTSDYLVFAGFCLAAGFSSKGFLKSISQKVLERVESVEDRQTSLEEELDPIIDRETEPELIDSSEIVSRDLGSEEIEVLKALNNPKFARRYVAGIMADTGFDDIRVTVILNALKNEGLVHQRLGRKNKDLFWLTHEGRSYVRSI